MKPKLPKGPKTIEASRIILSDAKGKTRIVMDAGRGDGYASICLFGNDGKTIQIATQPEGGLCIALLGRGGRAHANLLMRSGETAGLAISDTDGKIGTHLGSSFDEDGIHRLVLCQRGQPAWWTPSRTSRPTLGKRKRK